MKKIGVLYGRENVFPSALVDRINQKQVPGIVAEAVLIDKVIQAAPTEYAVIIDRISQDVPFYRAYLKNAAISGTSVINNPFWWSADEKFFNNALAETIGIQAPKTVLFPSNHRPDDTSPESFRNLALPLDYDAIFEYIGWPAFFKPFAGGGWKNVYKLHSPEEFFAKYNETGQLVMMLQENIDFEHYFRCYCLDQKHVRIMPYEPRNPFHERYIQLPPSVSESVLKEVKRIVLALNEYLGYDFNTVEVAVKDGKFYPIDFCNPAPDADDFSVGKENFEWVVETAATMAIERAQKQEAGKMNLTWGKFVQQAVAMAPVVPPAPNKAAAKPESTKAVETKEPAKKAAPAQAEKKAEASKAPAAKKPEAKPAESKPKASPKTALSKRNKKSDS